LKDLADFEGLNRGMYNQHKPIKTQKHRVDWDPSVKMGESSNTYNKEPLKPSQDYKTGKRKSFNYPTPPIFDPKTSNADQFVSTFNNFAEWNEISMRERAQLFQSYLSPKTFEWLNSLPKEIKLDYKCLIDSFLAKYSWTGKKF